MSFLFDYTTLKTNEKETKSPKNLSKINQAIRMAEKVGYQIRNGTVYKKGYSFLWAYKMLTLYREIL